ncbi:hypothetical protein CM240_0830 [Clostridium bornimense]|uniref:Exo-alpha-sialidase n=1 Tax=Clostridium bornimense TaxID=1216932 RepID=W6SEC7_9CLOT|nr:hypothetical protein [Clostridium bornimense]CDM67995.1 hypothetical protein CM240_0830 [Clostridium bornimense]
MNKIRNRIVFVLLMTFLVGSLLQGCSGAETVKSDKYTETTLKLKNNNMYKTNFQGVLEDIRDEIEMPEQLYVDEDNNISMKFKANGIITFIKGRLYGVNKEGETIFYDMYYNREISKKIKVRYNIANREIDDQCEIETLLDIMKGINLREAVYNWDSEEYGILFYGNRKWEAGTEGIIYVNGKGDKREEEALENTISTASMSLYIPEKEEIITPKRYILVKDINEINGKAYNGEDRINVDASMNMSSGEFEILDNGEVVYKLNNNVRYYLKIIAAAAGSREYGLYISEDDGDTWGEVNYEPLDKMGQAAFMIFIDEELGFISLATNGGKNGYLYRSEDGGYTFEEINYNESARNNNSSIDIDIEYFDYPEKVYKKDGFLYMEVGQGADGDYKGNCKGIYISRDCGNKWEFLKISNTTSDGD